MAQQKVRWAEVRGWEGTYEVSTYGEVANTRTGKTLTPMVTGGKRPGAARAKVRFSTHPRKDYDVAHLVLEAFVGPRPEGGVAMHLDDNQFNNRLGNLRWGTLRENARDCARKGRGGAQKLSADDVAAIRRRRASGESGATLARVFSVSQQRICDVHKGRTTL